MNQTGYTATWSLGYGYDRNGNQSVSLTQPGGEVLQFLPTTRAERRE